MTKDSSTHSSPKTLSQLVLDDPLTELARTSRQRLLLAAVMCLLISAGGLIPTKIDALGVEFPPPRQTQLVLALLFTLAYFLAEFWVYAWTDFQRWQNAIFNAVLAERQRRADENPDNETSAEEPSLAKILPFEIKLRLAVDFRFPIFMAGVASAWTAVLTFCKF